jgi:hypothetical protein
MASELLDEQLFLFEGGLLYPELISAGFCCVVFLKNF